MKEKNVMHISRREVLNNIIRFKDNLLERPGQLNKQKRSYRGLLNEETGDIRFSGKIPGPEHWKEIQIDVETGKRNEGCFQILDSRDKPLDPKQMALLAWRILQETMETLNQIASRHPSETKEMLPEEAAVQDLSEIHFSPFQSIEEIPGWVGPIDRMEAERLLKNKPIGTYLLRDGLDIAKVIARELADSNKMKVRSYICTVVEPEKKISDILLLLTDKGWILYRDNPDLHDSEYVYRNSPVELLHRLPFSPLSALGQQK